MKTQKFLQHCRTISVLMKRLALLANRLDEDCGLLTPTGGPLERIRRNLLEAFGITEVIRCAHLPMIDQEDPPTAFIMGLALDHLVRKVNTMANLLIEVEKRPKILPKYVVARAGFEPTTSRL